MRNPIVRLGTLFLTAAVVVGAPAGAPADTGSYTESVLRTTLAPKATTDLGLHCDDCVVPLDEPFPLQLYGEPAVDMAVSSNGLIEFGLEGGFNARDNICFPGGGMGPSVAAFWDELDTSGPRDGVFSSLTGKAPRRWFTIQWRGVVKADRSQVRVSAVFRESHPNEVWVVYEHVPDQGVAATAGLQSGGLGPFVNASCNQPLLRSGTTLLYRYQP